MRHEQIQERLKNLVDRARRDLRSQGSDFTEERLLGLMLANHFEWNGVKILKAAADALEDANFHQECELVHQMLKNIKRGIRN